MFLWRSGRSRAHAVDSAWSNRERRAAGSRSLTFAAASSSANGSPASRQQMEATAAAFASVREKVEDTARARSTNSLPEGESRTSSTLGSRVEAGNSSGETEYS